MWRASTPAVVVGIGLRHRLGEVVDLERCRADGVEVLERRAGGGALLLDQDSMLCGAICVPTSTVSNDITESYRWLGDLLITALQKIGVSGARLVEIDEARADVSRLREAQDTTARLILNTCYGALSPYEIVIGDPPGKIVGLAQVRRRHAALYQFGVLLEDQSRLANYLSVSNDDQRERLKVELKRRSVGITSPAVSEVASAIADAMPCAP